MNNAVFGKTMQNVRNHVNVRLVTHWDEKYGVEAMIAKPNFHSRIFFSENLVAIEMRKLEDRQTDIHRYLGHIQDVFCYKFHHEYMTLLF